MATRFYFSNTANSSGLTPAYDAGWGYTTEAARYDLAKTKNAADTVVTGAQIGPWTANTTTRALDRQYISEPLAAGVTISGSFTGWLRVREFNNGDNVDRICVKIYVVTSAGATRGTLVAINNGAVATTEFANNANLAARQFGSATTVTSVTASAGDRIVVEIGYRCNTAGTTPEASGAWGQSEADITAADQTTGSGWIEFSTDLPFPVEVSNALLSLYESAQSLSGTFAKRFEAAGAVSTTAATPYELIQYLIGLDHRFESLQGLAQTALTPYESQQEQITGDPVNQSAQTPMEIIAAATNALASRFESVQPITVSLPSLYETQQEVARLLANVFETQQLTSSQAGIRYESIQPLATLLAVWFESRQPMSSDATARIETIQPLAALSSSLYESLQSASATTQTVMEMTALLTLLAPVFIESGCTITRSGESAYEGVAPLVNNLQSRFEVVASALTNIASRFETTQGVEKSGQSRFEFTAALVRELPTGYESALALTTGAAAVHSMEAVAALIALMQSAQESVQSASRSMVTPFPVSQGTESSATTQYESQAQASAVNRSVAIPYESFGVLIKQCSTSIEGIAPLLNTARVITESKATLSSSVTKNMESFGQVAQALVTSYDTLVNIATAHSGATESLRSELTDASAPFELVHNLLVAGAAQVEAIGSVESSVTIPLEALQDVLAQYEAAYDAIQLLLAVGQIAYETKPQTVIKTFFFEQLAAIASTLADTIATLRTVVGDISTTSAVKLDSVASLPVVVDQVTTESSMTFDSIEVEVVDSDELEIG